MLYAIAMGQIIIFPSVLEGLKKKIIIASTAAFGSATFCGFGFSLPKPQNVADLKAAVQAMWNDLPDEIIRKHSELL